MNRNEIVGKRITAIFRTEYETVTSLLGVDHEREMQFCTYVLELDGIELLEFGTHTDHDPLKIFRVKVGNLTNESIASGVDCIGQSIVECLVSPIGRSIFLFLSNNYYIWVDEEEYGTVFRVEHEDYFSEGNELPMVTYWGNTETNYGCGSSRRNDGL